MADCLERNCSAIAAYRALENGPSIVTCQSVAIASLPLFRTVTPTWLKFVLLDCFLRKLGGLIRRLPLVFWKRHPLANDLPARLVIFHLGTFDGLRGARLADGGVT